MNGTSPSLGTFFVPSWPGKRRAAAQLLGAAFEEEKHFTSLLGAANNKPRRHLRALEAVSLQSIDSARIRRSGHSYGRVDAMTDADGTPVAVAVWLAPEGWPPPALAQLISIPSLFGVLWNAGPAAVRRLAGFGRRVAALPVHGDPWYLSSLGTHPSRQGKGLASRLLQHGIEVADSQGRAVLLDTQEDHTIRYYQRFGFQVAQTPLTFPGFTSWRLQRNASTPGRPPV